jgi:hypothetical protein
MSASTKLKLMSMQQKKKTAINSTSNEVTSPDSTSNLAASNDSLEIPQDSSRKSDVGSNPSPSVVKRLDVSLLFGSPKKI